MNPTAAPTAATHRVTPAAPRLSRVNLLLFFLAAIFLFTANLGATTLASLDDGFYAEKAAEMEAHPGFTVTWMGRPAFQNPPGEIWVLAASMHAFGVNDGAARVPAALFALGVLAGTVWIGARLVSPLAGLGAAALLALSPLFLNNARRVMLEMPSLFWMVLAMVALVEWRRRPRAIFLFAPALAMALLTKSVLGFTPLAVALVAALLLAEWRPLLRDSRFGLAVALGLLFGASWWIDQVRTFGTGFLKLHFMAEIGRRSLASLSAWQRISGYPRILLVEFQPVLLLAILGIAAAWKRRDEVGARLLLVWAILPVVVALFSAAQSSHYVFAILPALALIGAAWLASRWPGAVRVIAARVVPALMIAGGVVLWMRPQLLTRDVNRPFKDAAPVFAERVYAHVEVAFLGDDYWRFANPLMWYCGRELGTDARTVEEAMLRARASGGLLLVERGRLPKLPAAIASSPKILETKDAVLLDYGSQSSPSSEQARRESP